jgi:hypothetical protein
VINETGTGGAGQIAAKIMETNMVEKATHGNDDASAPTPEEGAKNDTGRGTVQAGSMIKSKKEHQPPADASDLDSLWLDASLGDGLVDTHYHSVAIGKPKDFFRVHPDPAYRRRTEIYVHKVEGVIDEQFFIIDKPMRGRFEEAKPCTLVTVVYRDGTPRLWALKLPKEGSGRDNEAWMSARSAARVAMGSWVKLLWVGKAYTTRNALPGYAPDPDYSKLPSFDELIRLAFGEHGIIRDEDHPIARALLGGAPSTKDEGSDGLS